MTTKHTPGPWEANQSELSAHSALVEIRGKNGAYKICDVGWQNARLIAAAPDLLASLKLIEQMFPPGTIGASASNVARAAIAKAEKGDA